MESNEDASTNKVAEWMFYLFIPISLILGWYVAVNLLGISGGWWILIAIILNIIMNLVLNKFFPDPSGSVMFLLISSAIIIVILGLVLIGILYWRGLPSSNKDEYRQDIVTAWEACEAAGQSTIETNFDESEIKIFGVYSSNGAFDRELLLDGWQIVEIDYKLIDRFYEFDRTDLQINSRGMEFPEWLDDSNLITCLDINYVTVETCNYEGGGKLHRIARDIDVTLVSWPSMDLVKSLSFEVPQPPVCPQTISNNSGIGRYLFGDFQVDINRWLSTSE